MEKSTKVHNKGMDSKSLKKLFIVLLMVEVFLFVRINLIPAPTGYFSFQDNIPSDFLFGFFIFYILYFLIYTISLIGLFFFKSWSPMLYLLSFVVGLSLLFSAYSYGHSFFYEDVIYSIPSVIILFLAFYTSLSKEFSKKS